MRESVPPVADFVELGLDPATAVPHTLLHFSLHREHLVPGNALLAPHFGICLQHPRPGASTHLRAGLGSAAVAEIGVGGVPVQVAATLRVHAHCHNQSQVKEPRKRNDLAIDRDRRSTLTSLKLSETKPPNLGTTLFQSFTSKLNTTTQRSRTKQNSHIKPPNNLTSDPTQTQTLQHRKQKT